MWQEMSRSPVPVPIAEANSVAKVEIEGVNIFTCA